MNWDCKNDFAAVSKIYENRELIVWDDCVKLNYMKKPSDNIELYDMMESYVVKFGRLG